VARSSEPLRGENFTYMHTPCVVITYRGWSTVAERTHSAGAWYCDATPFCKRFRANGPPAARALAVARSRRRCSPRVRHTRLSGRLAMPGAVVEDDGPLQNI
jgi:hypothetical protein